VRACVHVFLFVRMTTCILYHVRIDFKIRGSVSGGTPLCIDLGESGPRCGAQNKGEGYTT